jgi:carbamoyltransferase
MDGKRLLGPTTTVAEAATTRAHTPQPGGRATRATVVAGLGGSRQNAAVAIAVDGELRAFCEQERITRVRRAGFPRGSLPLEALDAALSSAGDLPRSAVWRYVTAEPGVDLPVGLPALHMDHHQAHAATAFALSPFDAAAALVCDRHSPSPATAWLASGDGLRTLDWPTTGPGLASLYSECAALFDLPPGGDHHLEALARLGDGPAAFGLDDAIAYRDGSLIVTAAWKARVAAWLAGSSGDSVERRARAAQTFQGHIGELLVRMVADLRSLTGLRRLVLGGGLFYNTWLTTLVRQSGIFEEVFVAPNPGNAGIAAGAALSLVAGARRHAAARVSPFLGPGYGPEDVKRTLDNCKLSYDVLDEHKLVETTVDALVHGKLVGWFQGRMEWGHRALGNRSILANPLSPYVLDNLNVYLKHRERHRTYGVSVPVEHVSTFFDGPPVSHFMEYEYAPRDRDRFGALLPEGCRSLRVQTVPMEPDAGSSRLFRQLHERFAEATGVPVLVNTSFNGFLEPMVCSPRDAVRVFFGTGLDLLVIDRFLIRK